MADRPPSHPKTEQRSTQKLSGSESTPSNGPDPDACVVCSLAKVADIVPPGGLVAASVAAGFAIAEKKDELRQHMCAEHLPFAEECLGDAREAAAEKARREA